MERLISGGMKEGPFDGNIVDIIRNEQNRLLFRLELCNITGLDEATAKIQISPMNWTAQGSTADFIENNFVNGDLVRAWGTVAVSEMKQTMKFRAKHIERLKIIIKEEDPIKQAIKTVLEVFNIFLHWTRDLQVKLYEMIKKHLEK